MLHTALQQYQTRLGSISFALISADHNVFESSTVVEAPRGQEFWPVNQTFSSTTMIRYQASVITKGLNIQ